MALTGSLWNEILAVEESALFSLWLIVLQVIDVIITLVLGSLIVNFTLAESKNTHYLQN